MKKVLALTLALLLLISGVALADITVMGPGLSEENPLTGTFYDSLENDYDYAIDYIVEPGYSDTVNMLTTQLASGDPSIDVMVIDEIMYLAFSRAGFLASLDDVITDEDFEGMIPEYVDVYAKYDGSIYAVPGFLEYFGFAANKAILDAAGVDVPTNEEEFIDVVSALTDEENEIYGFVAPFDKGAQLQDILRCFCMMYGGNYYDYTLEGTQKAVRLMHDLFGKYNACSKDMIAFGYSEAKTYFEDGHAGLYMNWATPSVTYNPDDEIVWILPPTFETNHCFLGGWLWVVNPNSEHLEEALDFVKRQATDEAQVIYWGAQNRVPAKSTSWDDERLRTDEIMIETLDSMTAYNEVGALSPRVISTRHSEFMDVATGTLQLYLLDEISFEECIETMQQQTESILSKAAD